MFICVNALLPYVALQKCLMNNIYRLVWNHVANSFIAVAETSRTGKKGSKTGRGSRKLLTTALIDSGVYGATEINANQRFQATEVALGTTWAVTTDVQAYTEVGKSWDNGGDTSVSSDISASVGMKIRF